MKCFWNGHKWKLKSTQEWLYEIEPRRIERTDANLECTICGKREIKSHYNKNDKQVRFLYE